MTTKLTSGSIKQFTKDEMRAMGFPVSDDEQILKGTITVDGKGATVNLTDTTNLREVDLAIAEQVFGFNRLTARVDPMNRDGEPQYHMGYPLGHDFAPAYSTDPAAMMLVIERMRELGWESVTAYGLFTDGEWRWTVSFHAAKEEYFKVATTLPRAVCQAALGALGGKEGE
jgi:hypothetical protein